MPVATADGETTEEDVPAPPVVRKKQPRRLERAGESSDSDTDRPRQSRKGRPRLERFDLDSTDVKPVAVYDPVKRKMIIFTPQKSRDFGLSPESFRGLQFYQSTVLLRSYSLYSIRLLHPQRSQPSTYLFMDLLPTLSQLVAGKVEGHHAQEESVCTSDVIFTFFDLQLLASAGCSWQACSLRSCCCWRFRL